MPDDIDALVQHLGRSGLNPGQARRLVEDVLAYFDETVEAYVARRHRELMRDGVKNSAIYRQLAAETRQRRFLTAPLSERQIRRMIYG